MLKTSIPDGQDGDLDSTNPVKQIVSQLLSSEGNPGSWIPSFTASYIR